MSIRTAPLSFVRLLADNLRPSAVSIYLERCQSPTTSRSPVRSPSRTVRIAATAARVSAIRPAGRDDVGQGLLLQDDRVRQVR
jgi:hypothetical protein